VTVRSSLRSTLRCAGCGAAPAPADPYGWVCPNRGAGDDVDHVMVRGLDPDGLGGLSLASERSEQPFIRYRALLHSYHRWTAAGRDDARFVGLVEELDVAVAAVDGRGFRRTPLEHFPALDAAVGARVWVKDETGNVAGSHKGRHLFGVLLFIRVLERLGLVGPEQSGAPLAIASCGNAALAAAVMAAAARRRLVVFVPVDADRAVVTRLGDLGADVIVCERQPGEEGDPCYRSFVDAVAGGAIPFGCQGPDNGLTVEGGATLAWEMVEQLAALGSRVDRLVVQVGGGALASACFQGMEEAVALGTLATLPEFDAVQTVGAAPLARAHRVVTAQLQDGLSVEKALSHAAHHRSRYMWPWEAVPLSVAGGILDDETYDWLAVMRGLISTSGSVVVVNDDFLEETNRLARDTTGINVDHTGSAGLAGLLQLSRDGQVPTGSDVAVIFSGARR
jgi:threonine dehydratase